MSKPMILYTTLLNVNFTLVVAHEFIPYAYVVVRSRSYMFNKMDVGSVYTVVAHYALV